MTQIVANRPAWVLFCVILGTTTVSINNSTVNPAIPVFMELFHLPPSVATWIMAVFMTSMGIAMPLTHYLSVKLGRKTLYMAGLSLFLLGSIIGATAHSIATILIARAAQGAASGFIVPLSLALIYATYPKEKRGQVTGIWGAATMLSPALGPVVGGVIVETLSWHFLFILNLPFLLIALLVGWKVLANDKQKDSTSFDLLGYLLIALGMGLLLYGMGQIHSLADLLQTRRLLLICLALTLLGGFAYWSSKQPSPLLNLSLFRFAGYRDSTIIAVIQAIGMFQTLFLLPLLVQFILARSALDTGLLLLITALCASAVGPLAGRLLDKYGPRWLVSIGLAVCGVATLCLGFIHGQSPIWLVALVCAMRGIGVGLSYIPITSAGMSALPDDMVTQGAVMNNISRRLCSSLGLVLGAIWLELSHANYLDAANAFSSSVSLKGLSDLFIFTGVLTLATLPLACRFPQPNSTVSVADFSLQPITHKDERHL